MSDEQSDVVVQIVEDETGKIAYQSQPTYQRRAEKIESGMGINLDWANFSTRIVPASEAVPASEVG